MLEWGACWRIESLVWALLTDGEDEMVGVLELSSPVLALESGLGLDAVKHLIEGLSRGGGDVFDGRVGFQGQDGDLGCWG